MNLGEIPRDRYRTAGGFTLIDVLVSMAVVAVLISLLSPSLTSVRETAHQVVCRSNVRQIGIGIYQHAQENDDRVPPTTSLMSGSPWESTSLRLAGPHSDTWDGLGRLYSGDFLPAPKLYYCPSHSGKHRFQQYEDQWGGWSGAITGNYQYRGGGPSIDAPSNSPNSTTTYLSKIRGSTALISDGLRSRSDFNHVVGTNVLRADLAVDWYRDQGGRLYELLPKEDQTPTASGILEAWNALDDPR
jgi:type II secretory pathway pseudopilin PulG